jgi:hypothetical protein
MGITYEKADAGVHRLVRELVDAHHPDLKEAEARITVLVACLRDEDGALLPTSAVKWHGYEAAAVVKVNSLRDRAEGKADATITLDGNSWEKRPAEEQRGVLDHELCHLEVRRDGHNQVLADDLGRPRLRLRNADWMLEGFRARRSST